jgi:ribosomal protein S18 acetylase RimI-like enzyme
MTKLEPRVRIRAFHFPDDVEPARRLWEASGPGVHVGRSDSPDEIARKLQRDPDLFLVAEAFGELVGTVIGGYDGRRGMVYHLAVQPHWQGRGIGSALMDEVERRLAAKGCLKSYLLVVDGNGHLFDFYKKHGWEPMNVTVLGKELR